VADDMLDGTEEWVQTESSFGRLGSVDLHGAVQAMRETVCGGIGAADEPERPLLLIMTTADYLERQFPGWRHLLITGVLFPGPSITERNNHG